MGKIDINNIIAKVFMDDHYSDVRNGLHAMKSMEAADDIRKALHEELENLKVEVTIMDRCKYASVDEFNEAYLDYATSKTRNKTIKHMQELIGYEGE